MKRLMLSLPAFLLFSFTISGQEKLNYYPPTDLRNGSNYLPGHVDLIWAPPQDWIPSKVDRWYEYDRGIYGDNAIGSCPGCPVEVAIRWDSGFFSNYNAVYLTKIRFVLNEPDLDHALRVYQVHSNVFDTLFNYPLTNNLVYHQFDTLEFSPITINKNKELWVGLWVSDLGPGFPLAVGLHPAIDGYSNMIKLNPYGEWETLLDLNPDLNYPWNIGAYIETPDEVIHYPVFNVYRSIDDQPFEKIHEGDIYDTIFHDDVYDEVDYVIKYYVGSLYSNGTIIPSDTLELWTVNVLENEKKKELVIYPNPASHYVTVRSLSTVFEYISIFNTNGQEVIKIHAGSGKTVIDISNLPEALYVVNAYSKSKVLTSKLLLVR